ncbi:MAG: sugar ABC transporter substrate-binding protein [Actinomycetaceae bacterium]|nr:sugar ABC transporter substrate-binding protein [Actinomycetaceae bacterium]MDY5272614.1 sugar ABC transporter substrate-binding protein [Arcanobacterium sp.]
MTGVLSLALVLAGCSSSLNKGATETSGDQVTITYSNFTSNGGNEKNLEKIVSAFEKENPNIKVKVTTLPYADYFTTLQTDLASGTVADVFDLEYANYAAYQNSGVLAPIEGVDMGVYQKSLADAYTTDGKAYALPTSFSNVVLFYNKDLFDAAGVKYPTADWTWADEQAAAEKLTDAARGVFGDYQPISYNEYYKAVAQAGGSLLDTKASKATFNSPEGKRAAQWLVGKSGTTMPTAEQGAGTPDFDANLFVDGKLAMWHTGIWMFSSLDKVPFAWDIAVEPGDTTPASALFSNGVAVSANTKHKDAAIKFAYYLTSSDTTVDVRLAAGWELPTIADQSKLGAYLKLTPPESKKVVFDSLEKVALAPSIGDNQAQMQDAITDALTEAAAGRITVDDALATAQQQVDKLLK